MLRAEGLRRRKERVSGVAEVQGVRSPPREREELERSEALWRSLFEQASEGITIADLDGRYTDANPAACAMLGYVREELVGMNIVEVLVPEDVPRLLREKLRLLVPGQTQVAEWTLRRKDGSLLAVEASAKILADGRWQAFARDIGARKRAEAALKASEEALNRAQRVARVGSWDWDLRTDEMRRSNQLYELLGVERRPELERALALSHHVPADERAEVRRVVDEAIRARRAYSIEHRIVRSDGQELIVRQQGEPVLEGGRPVRMVGTLLDITDLRHAQRESEASLRWFRAVFDQSPVGLALLRGARGDRVELNRHLQILLGETSRHTGIDSGIVFELDGERPLAFDALPIMRARRGERIDGIELLVRQPSGKKVHVLVSAAPILDPSGGVDGSVVAVQDITAAKQLERLRAEWSSIVAHDLRQPLNAISLGCQLLRRGVSTDPTLLVVAERALGAAKRLDHMIHDLMDLSRLESARVHLSVELVDLLALARASIVELAMDASNPRIELRTHGDVPQVRADPDRLMQVFANLLSNAIKYGRPSTPIVVDITSTGREVAVAVTNAGEGIAREDLPRLFQRFERVDPEKHGAIKGVGLGLHITRGLVEAHGGRIEVESTPGATTTFRFTLPVG